MIDPRLGIEKLSAISLRDGNKPVLRRVSLTVGTGEVHGLVGESGAGKSTIAKAILGIVPSQVRITGGRIAFEDRDLLALSRNELRAVLGRDIALIAQDPSTALNPTRRIDAQMTDGLRLKRGLSAKAARVRAGALLTLEMGIAVVVEAILSFVGLSVSSDTPTWGGMIAEGRQFIHQTWWVFAAPLAALFATVLAFNQLGDGLRRALDPVLNR